MSLLNLYARLVVIGACISAAGTTVNAQDTVTGVPSPLFSPAHYSSALLANEWKLDIEEIERYQRLMITEQSYSQPGITPYEVLGKHARSADEMRRYAQLNLQSSLKQHIISMEWAIVTAEQTGSNNAMALDIVDGSEIIRNYLEKHGIPRSIYAQAAQRELLGLTGKPHAGAMSPARAGASTNRVRLFLDLMNCDDACTALWHKARGKQTLGQIDAIDVVVMDHDGTRTPKDAVVAWAQAQGIQPDELEPPRAVTLNFESSKFNAILDGRTAPLAITMDGSVLK